MLSPRTKVWSNPRETPTPEATVVLGSTFSCKQPAPGSAHFPHGRPRVPGHNQALCASSTLLPAAVLVSVGTSLPKLLVSAEAISRPVPSLRGKMMTSQAFRSSGEALLGLAGLPFQHKPRVPVMKPGLVWGGPTMLTSAHSLLRRAMWARSHQRCQYPKFSPLSCDTLSLPRTLSTSIYFTGVISTWHLLSRCALPSSVAVQGFG